MFGEASRASNGGLMPSIPLAYWLGTRRTRALTDSALPNISERCRNSLFFSSPPNDRNGRECREVPLIESALEVSVGTPTAPVGISSRSTLLSHSTRSRVASWSDFALAGTDKASGPFRAAHRHRTNAIEESEDLGWWTLTAAPPSRTIAKPIDIPCSTLKQGVSTIKQARETWDPKNKFMDWVEREDEGAMATEVAVESYGGMNFAMDEELVEPEHGVDPSASGTMGLWSCNDLSPMMSPSSASWFWGDRCSSELIQDHREDYWGRATDEDDLIFHLEV